MRLGINLLPYEPHKQGGAEIYLRNLVRELAITDLGIFDTVVLFVTPQSKGKYLPTTSNFKEYVLPTWSVQGRLARIVAEQLLMPFYIRKAKIDCLFSNYVIPVLAPIPQVVNVHDMLYKRLPQMVEPAKRLYWTIFIPLSLRRARKIMTVSNSSAEDIQRYFPHVKEKLSVTVEGVNLNLAIHRDVNPSLVEEQLGIKAPFILSAATFAPHKNLKVLIKAFALVHEQFPDTLLVLTGRANTDDALQEQQELIELARSKGLEKHIIFTGYVSEKVLAALYRTAEAYVIPSIYEGFGLSVIEAQFFGTPVITSDAPALKEVGGEATIVASAQDECAFAKHISDLLQNDRRRKELIERGFANIKQYNWKAAAEDVVTECQAAII